MIRGLYTAASGMVASMRRMHVLTNDIVNAQTPGYKRDVTASAAFAEQVVQQVVGRSLTGTLGSTSLANVAEEPELDLGQGALQATGRDLDLALSGPGFLAVQGQDGVRYTRDGSLSRNALGQLVTSSGSVVLGEQGPLEVPDGTLSIGADGTVSVDDALVGRLLVVDFGANQPLEKVGRNELQSRDPAAVPTPATGTAVVQGAIEQSNVDLSTALTTSLVLQRAYEACQRMIQQQDTLMGYAANDIAKPAI